MLQWLAQHDHSADVHENMWFVWFAVGYLAHMVVTYFQKSNESHEDC